MANKNPRTDHLPKQPTRWQHLPTQPIRVPACYVDEISGYAQALDLGKIQGTLTLPLVVQWLKGVDDVDLLANLLHEVEAALAQAKERSRDKRIEQAILLMARRCDGASTQDGGGFNSTDARIGKSLANRIESGMPLLKVHAYAALAILQKYKQTQLAHIELPSWNEIAHQYPDRLPPQVRPPEKRVEIIADSIAVFAPYDPSGGFQKKAKQIKGYRFNSKDKSWRYPMSCLESVVNAFPVGEYRYSEEIEGAIANLEKRKAEVAARLEAEALTKSSEVIKLVRAADVDAPLANGWSLRDYQKRGVEWLLAHHKRGIYNGGVLADHMGLGKTITTLVAAKAMQRVYQCPILAIAPVSLMENWLREAERVEVRIECFSWAKVPKPLESQQYVLICDEAHYLQNYDSQRTQKVLGLARHDNCLATWLLTGTPIKNGRPINLYPLLVAIGHPLAETKWDYQKRYCNAHHKSIGSKRVWDATGASHLDELSAKTQDAILRRTKQECLTELPAKTRLLQQVELEPAKAKAYQAAIKKLVKDYRDRASMGLVDPDSEALVTINILRQCGSSFKVEVATQLAQELLEQGQQVVLFTEFLESAKALYTALGGELLTGETKPEDRQAMVDRFQSGASPVFNGTLKAGGVGLTLTAASHVVLVDRPWTPGDTEQAEDRCHRLGQANAVFATWLQLGEIDKAIDALIESKQRRIELVLQGKRKTLNGLSSPKELAKELIASL
ncbi:DEAD/DEAH box helicase [Kamptonema cortianum]|nr:DEAD/DEAH box helicase [Kamptonema cortianum]